MRQSLSRHLLVIASTTLLLSAPCPADESPSSSAATLTTDSFEQSTAGRFGTLNTSLGTWTPTTGLTVIDDQHAKTGKQCLQLTGGEQTSVTLELFEHADTTGILSFHAERWTSRSPFSFRIEKYSGGEWSEIHNGDKTVRVGRSFLSHVNVRLADQNIQRLRFTVTSPPNTGILIDDIRLAPATPQQITSVELVPLTVPVLVGAQNSALVKLKVETTGSLNPISLTDVSASFPTSNPAIDIAWLTYSEQLPTTIAIGMFQNFNGVLEFTGQYPLAEGTNSFCLAVKVNKDANIDQKISANINNVTFSNGRTFPLNTPHTLNRMGVAVRKRGDDGVHTFRIPGLATTNKKTLIGVYDVRRRSGGDLPGDIDVGMSRSTDGGRTWQPMQIIMDMGEDSQWNYDGIGDPAILVDRNTGTIWVAATWSHGNRSWHGSGPGLTPEDTGQLMLTRSDDDGLTWSPPINITSQVKKPEWSFLLQGPGKGITMRDGTLVFAAQYRDAPEQQRLPHSTIIYSTDHGNTWQVGTGAFDDTTEAQVVEIEPGVLMLNCRYNRKPARVVMTTRDLGETWQTHATSERSLIEPG